MGTKRVDKAEVNKWIKWLESAGYNRPYYGLTPKHPAIKHLKRVLEMVPPIIPGTRPRDGRTIVTNLDKYERGNRGLKFPQGYATNIAQRPVYEHHQRLYELLKQFQQQLKTPKLVDLYLRTVSDHYILSYSYELNVPTPAIILKDKSIRLGVESSSSPPWDYLIAHIQEEFEGFNFNLEKWKNDIAALVVLCNLISESISNQLIKNKWPIAEGDLSMGVHHDILSRVIYECAVTRDLPEFVTIPEAKTGTACELYFRYRNGMRKVAREEPALLKQVQDYCVKTLKSASLIELVNRTNEIVAESEKQGKTIKDMIMCSSQDII